MQHPITQRINFLINHYSSGNVSAFSKSINQSKQSINRLFNIDTRSGQYPIPSNKIIESICQAYPEVNYTWLVTGEGLPFKTSDQTQPIARENTIGYGSTDWQTEAEYWRKEYISVHKKYTALLENKLEELFAIKREAGI